MRDEPSGRVRRLSSTRRQAVDRQPLRAEYSDDRQTDSATNVLKTHGRTTQLTFSQHSVDYLNWNCRGCETPFSFLASSVRVLCRSPRSPTPKRKRDRVVHEIWSALLCCDESNGQIQQAADFLVQFGSVANPANNTGQAGVSAVN